MEKALWSTLNEIMGRKTNSTAFIESSGSIITKPFDVNDYLNGQRGQIQAENANSEPSYSSIKNLIMKEKHCKFEFCKVSVGEVDKLLLSINNDKPPGIDNLN